MSKVLQCVSCGGGCLLCRKKKVFVQANVSVACLGSFMLLSRTKMAAFVLNLMVPAASFMLGWTLNAASTRRKQSWSVGPQLLLRCRPLWPPVWFQVRQFWCVTASNFRSEQKQKMCNVSFCVVKHYLKTFDLINLFKSKSKVKSNQTSLLMARGHITLCIETLRQQRGELAVGCMMHL